MVLKLLLGVCHKRILRYLVVTKPLSLPLKVESHWVANVVNWLVAQEKLINLLLQFHSILTVTK